MCKSMRKIYRDTKLIIGAVSALITLAITHCVQAGIPDQTPLFLKSPVRPIMMLNMSKEHQLFFKLYDDYSDITRPDGGAPDGLPDFEGYNNNYDYYGYFDSDKCYVYSTTEKRFEDRKSTRLN